MTAESTTMQSDDLEVSVVMPCLNEADTLGACIDAVKFAYEQNSINGEIVVADNGSTDGSREIAEERGARVVPVATPGYGSALMGGIDAAGGKYVIMADSDESYDFKELGKFVDLLRRGNQLVQGCRLPRGGGTILPGAMPFLHRWLGNPLFSFLTRLFFRSPIDDVYCGYRGFEKSLYNKLDQRCTGMEFAVEMVIKATLSGARIAQVPITLHPDGRTSHGPHLRTLQDGWRTLRFLLMFAPHWLFLGPGAALILLGIVGYALALPGVNISGVIFDAHTLLFSTLFIMLGLSAVTFFLFAKAFAVSENFIPQEELPDTFSKASRLEVGAICGLLIAAVGFLLLLRAFLFWRATGFGALDYASTMRIVVPGAMLAAVGTHVVWSSFLLSLLSLRRR